MFVPSLNSKSSCCILHLVRWTFCSVWVFLRPLTKGFSCHHLCRVGLSETVSLLANLSVDSYVNAIWQTELGGWFWRYFGEPRGPRNLGSPGFSWSIGSGFSWVHLVHVIWVLLGSPGPWDLGSPGFTWSMGSGSCDLGCPGCSLSISLIIDIFEWCCVLIIVF